MTKPQLVEALSNESGVAKKDVESVLTAFIKAVDDNVLKDGDTISLPGLGIFKQKQTAARTGRNPGTGEAIQISAKTSIAFKMSSTLKD